MWSMDGVWIVGRGAGEGQGRHDSSRRQEGTSVGSRGPRPMWTQRSDGGEVTVSPAATTGCGDSPLPSGDSLPSRLKPSALVQWWVCMVTVAVRLQLSGASQVSKQQGWGA